MKNIRLALAVLTAIIVLQPVFSQENAASERQLNTLRYGTETEIASLINTLKNERDNSLDEELIKLAEVSRNRNILIGIFSFFGEEEKTGLEERAIRILEERDDEAGDTVLAAINYLGWLKVSAAVDTLRLLVNSGESRYQNTAIRALGRAARGGDEQLADDTADFLLSYYKDKNPSAEDQREIITALGETGSVNTIEFLSSLITNNDERAVLRMAALESISKIPNSGNQGLDAVISAVSASDPNVRSSAIAALGPFSGALAEQAILDGFRDSYYRTRMGAAQAAGQRKMEEAVPYLRYRAENDEVPAVKDEAIKALGEIGNAEAIRTLDAIFSERKNSDRVRIIAAEMLLKIDSPSWASKVIVELDDAKATHQTALYNGFLRVLGPSVSPSLESLARRFFASGTVVEISYALDMVLNNEFRNMAAEVRLLLDERRNNASIVRKAALTLERLGLEATAAE